MRVGEAHRLSSVAGREAIEIDLFATDPRPARTSGVEVDRSSWPLVVLRWPGGERDDREVARAIAVLDLIAGSDEAHAVLVDAADARAPTPSQLGMILDCARRAGPQSRCVATAIVTRSPVSRAIVDSVRWMALTPARWGHFASAEAARPWLEAQLNGRRDASATYPVVRDARRPSSPPPR